MKNERSIKRAILAVLACGGTYLAIGFVAEFIYAFVIAILGELYMDGYDITSAALVIMLIMFLVAIAIAFSEYKLAMKLIPKIAENTPTEILSFRIFGWLLICVSIIEFFVSLLENSNPSIYGIIIGILFILHARKLRRLYAEAKEYQADQKGLVPTVAHSSNSDAWRVQEDILAEKDVPEEGSYV